MMEKLHIKQQTSDHKDFAHWDKSKWEAKKKKAELLQVPWHIKQTTSLLKKQENKKKPFQTSVFKADNGRNLVIWLLLTLYDSLDVIVKMRITKLLTFYPIPHIPHNIY